jgi:hypothetical protein
LIRSRTVIPSFIAFSLGRAPLLDSGIRPSPRSVQNFRQTVARGARARRLLGIDAGTVAAFASGIVGNVPRALPLSSSVQGRPSRLAGSS